MARRSLLFAPADQPDLCRKAASAGADAAVYDLEDAVSPDGKGEARTAVHDLLSDPTFDPDCDIIVRINSGSTGDADLETLAPVHRLDALMVPKVSGPESLDSVASILAVEGTSHPLLALIESAAGVQAAPSIAAHDSVETIVFGAEDLAADIGATRTPEGTEVSYARQRVVIAAAAADCAAVDTIVADYGDEELLRADAAMAVQLGFDGKLAIHPAQVAPINEAFTPEPDDVAWAERVLEASRDADSGVFEVDGEMIDAPLIAQAEQIIERAQADRD